MDISSAMVKALREKTGLPMMECKKALEEAQGNDAQAMEILRKKGLAQLTKRAERETAHGRLFMERDPGSGRVVLLELLCETEPVAGTEDFLKLGREAAQAALKLPEPTAGQVQEQPLPSSPGRKVIDALHDVVNRIRENIRIRRVAAVSGHTGYYIHHDGRKGVLVELSGACPPETAADVCMHIAAMRPLYNRREDVEADLVEKERALAREQVTGKPPQIVDKIVQGKLDKWFQEMVLLEQPFVKDDKVSVQQHLNRVSPGLTVKKMVRIEIGEA